MNVAFFQALEDPSETGWFARHTARLNLVGSRRAHQLSTVRLWSVPVELAHFFYCDVAHRVGDGSHAAACAGWQAGTLVAVDDELSDEDHSLLAAFRHGKVAVSSDDGQTWILAPTDANRPEFWRAAAALAELKSV